MTDDVLSRSRVPTGVPGLDDILEGGLLQGGVYIIEGPPGAGKTTLASQLCFHHARAGGRTVYITLLAESHMRLIGHLKRMAFFDAALVPEGVSYLSAFKVLESEGLDSLIRTVRQTVSAQRASVLVLDGLVSAEEASPTTKDFKKFIHELQIVTAMTGCIALLLSSTERPREYCAERTMVDGVIELDDELVGLAGRRSLLVRKMRGTSAIRGKHTLEISDAGVSVLPRIEVLLGSEPKRVAPPDDARKSFGLPFLDAMLEGGLPPRSMTAVLGPTGSGKTILGLHFLEEGVRRGEPGVFFGFYERPEALLRKAEVLDMQLPEAVRDGQVALVWHRPVENVIDILGHSLLSAVERTGARRVCIDGMQGFQSTSDNPLRTREILCSLSDRLASVGVTSVYTSETPDLYGASPVLSTQGLSAITENVLWLRREERKDGQLGRTVAVLKLRDGGHDRHVRPYEITPAFVPAGRPGRANTSARLKARAIKAKSPTRSSRGKKTHPTRKSRA